MEGLGIGEAVPEGGRGVREDECEAASSSPSAAEFAPVWPLPPAPHRRSAALKPLLFPEPDKEDRTYLLRRSRDLPLPCVLCERCFGEGVRGEEGCVWEGARDALLHHLLADHSLIIHQVDSIASLRRSAIVILSSPILKWPLSLPSDTANTGKTGFQKFLTFPNSAQSSEQTLMPKVGVHGLKVVRVLIDL